MDGGDGPLGFRRGNVLDPSAQEFHPAPYHFALGQPQIYYPYPPPPPPPAIHFLPPPPSPPPLRTLPAYVSHGPAEALPDAVPTRSILLSSVPLHVSEGVIRMELESFGGVRAIEMGRLAAEAIVTVHFYDLRAARAALEAVRDQHVRQQGRVWRQLHGTGGVVPVGNWGPPPPPLGIGLVAGRAVWAQFAPEPSAPNNGSLVVFNLDPGVSSQSLKEVFEAFGTVKETRETPMKPRHRFIEFFDTRDAGRALVELSGREIFGKKVVIEFSRPGGHGRSNYSRKTSNHQPIQLPPRFATLPRSSSNISSSSSSHGRGASPPEEVGVPAGEGSVDGDECMPLKKADECKRRGSRTSLKQLPHGSSCSGSSRQRSFKNMQRSRNRAAMEAKFLIKGEPVDIEGSSSSPSSGLRDSRTTVMIKNIPNKYSQKLLLNMLDNHCVQWNEEIASKNQEEPFSSYDFVYLPIDFNNKCNVGYGFVNMTSPEATWRLYKDFHLQHWKVFNSKKISQITYARVQGLEALMEHFRNSKFACDKDEYLPVFFTPPRDGRNLTPPTTVGCRNTTASSSSSTAALSKMVLLRVTSSDEPTDGGGSSSPGSTTSRVDPTCCGEEEEEEESNDDE